MGLYRQLIATLQGSAPSQRQQESHIPLSLQNLELVQYVRLDEGKIRYLNILAQDHNFLGAKFCTAT